MALLFSLVAPGAFCRAQDLIDAPGPGYPHELIGAPGRGFRHDLIQPELAPVITSDKPAASEAIPQFRFELKPPSPDSSQASPSIQPAPAPAKPLDLLQESSKEKVPPGWTLRPFNGVPYYFVPLTH